jgi:hypothetical protein
MLGIGITNDKYRARKDGIPSFLFLLYLLVLHHGLKGILLYIFLEKSFKNERQARIYNGNNYYNLND